MPALRLVRAAVFAVVCVAVSLSMHVLAGGAAVDLPVLAAAVPPVGGGAFVLARRQRGLGALLGASFAAQYGLHHLFSAGAPQESPAVHQHGGPLTMLAVHAGTALLSAYWLERGETALATLLRLLVASVLTLLVWWALPAVRRLVPRPSGESEVPSVSRLLAAAVSRRGPPTGSSVI